MAQEVNEAGKVKLFAFKSQFIAAIFFIIAALSSERTYRSYFFGEPMPWKLTTQSNMHVALILYSSKSFAWVGGISITEKKANRSSHAALVPRTLMTGASTVTCFCKGVSE